MFEEAFTQAGPVKIHHKQTGAGKPLLLLHGWGGQADSFAPVALAFSGSRRVYAIDFPGFGQSGLPPPIRAHMFQCTASQLGDPHKLQHLPCTAQPPQLTILLPRQHRGHTGILRRPAEVLQKRYFFC